MKTVRRLFYGEVMQAVLMVTLGFVALFYFFDFVEELQAVGKHSATGYTVAQALLYVALMVPSHVYELLPVEGGVLSMAEVKGMEKMRVLDRQTFRPSYLDDMGLKSGHLRHLGQLAPQVRMRQITRPRSHPTLDEIVDVLKVDWA